MNEHTLPAWIKEPPSLEDEIIKGPWGYHALQMANKFYRPRQLAYQRTVHGEDQRIKYIVYFLDLRGLRILELGPYEGHHSIIIEKMGARENIALEAREDNLRKCLRIKEKYHLQCTTFLRHNIENIYCDKEKPQFKGRFDLVFCCGILYHFAQPVAALEWCAKQAAVLFLGTHYIEPAEMPRYHPDRYRPAQYVYKGVTYQGMAYDEGETRDPITGMSKLSFWPFENDLVQMLRHAGYKNIAILGKDLQNRLPHVTILAET